MERAAAVPPAPADGWVGRQREGEAEVLYLRGAWRLPNVPAIAEALRAMNLAAPGPFVLDGSRLEALDTAAGFVLVRHLAQLGCTQAMLVPRGFEPRHRRLLALVHERMATPAAATRTARLSLVQGVGAAALELGRQLSSHTGFVGSVVLELAGLLRRPRLFRPRETVAQFEAVCIDAIPIVVLVNFLIGVVIAYVLGVQAQRYGANIFVADGIGLAVCRELSPILGSVLVAGRSGAAFTVQIGTMKVTEEIDAISTLGLLPLQVLVIPRLVALMVALPLLVFVGDLAGVAGGLLIGFWQLDIAAQVFVDRVHDALTLQDVMVGLGKAPVFAAFIALIACRMGLVVDRDARSIGENTTSTVVQCIVWVFLLDAGFAVMFQELGI